MVFVVVGLFIFAVYLFSPKKTNIQNTKDANNYPSQAGRAEEKKTTSSSRSIFIPYWDIPADAIDANSYDSVIYFGIAAGESGIDTKDAGYKRLQTFSDAGWKRKTYLTLRMLNDDINTLILNDPEKQKILIKEVAAIAQKYSFDGIVLDLEVFSIFDDRIKNQINTFVQRFYTDLKQEKIQLFMTLYGDLFYRKRPYDLQFIAKNTDGIIIMAYDFHKSRGEPGPNFPFAGKDLYTYDFQTMINDFLYYTSAEKITVVFGMYGYDWIVDEQKRPIKPAKAISLNEITKKFIQSCQWKNCVVQRNDKAKETEINYIDEFDNFHIIWFEDEESAKAKSDYAGSLGVGNIGFWAWGYF